MSNTISEVTRRNIFDELRLSSVLWCGRMAEEEFLSRVFELTKMPSYDHRCSTMAGEVALHRSHFHDWSDDWPYEDSRLDLLRGPDERFLRFLCEMIHPLVRQDGSECEGLRTLFNNHLVADGFEIVAHRFVSQRPIYAARAKMSDPYPVVSSAKHATSVLDSAHVSAQVTRMETALVNDPPLAIGTSKEFVESICKGVLDERGVSRTGAEDLQKLVKMAREALGLESDDPNGSIRKVMNGLATVTQGIAELRGLYGTGHGPAPGAAVADPVLARLIVGAGISLGVFLLSNHHKTAIREDA